MRTLPVFVYRLYGLLRQLFFCLAILIWLNSRCCSQDRSALILGRLDVLDHTLHYTITWPAVRSRSSSSTSLPCPRRAIPRLIWWTLAAIQVLLLESGEGEKGE